MRDIALYQIRPALSTIPGVASIGVLGGETAEYRVTVDPEKLDSFGLTIADVGAALSASNVISAVGRLEDHNKLYLVLSNTQFNGFDEIGQTVIRSGGNGLVLVEDVATVSPGAAPQWTRVTADGHDAVLFQVYQQPGGNTVQIQRQLGRNRRVAGASAARRADRQLVRPKRADRSVGGSVRDAVLIGVVLAVVVLLLFLRSVKLTLIAMIAVPTVLATTMLLLAVLGMSFNIMTLGGMAAAVGLIVDDAIVMIEHILRRLQRAGRHHERIWCRRANYAALGRLVGLDDHHLRPAGVPVRRDRRFFQGAVADHGDPVGFRFSWRGWSCRLSHGFFCESATRKRRAGGVSARVRAGYARLMQLVLPRPWIILSPSLPCSAWDGSVINKPARGSCPRWTKAGSFSTIERPQALRSTETDRMLRELETDSPGHAGSSDLFSPHGPATRRRSDRGQRGRFFCPPQAAAATGPR